MYSRDLQLQKPCIYIIENNDYPVIKNSKPQGGTHWLVH